MNTLAELLGNELVNALGWTFVHSLWQGSLIAFAMILALQNIPSRNAQLRYAVASGSMVTMLVSAIATFLLLYMGPSPATEAGRATGAVAAGVYREAAAGGLKGWLNANLGLLVTIWVMGSALLAVRLLVGLLYVQRLKSANTPVAEAVFSRAMEIAGRMSCAAPLRVAESALVSIPVVVGHIKPVILFPVGAVNQLSSEEVEAVLAHEIAHLVRNDFIQNLVQSVIEVLFYYHPAVWWISAMVRTERENCCDDLAIHACGSSFSYARALLRLQEVGGPTPALALPLSGSKNHLLNRVRRILNQPQNKSNIMEKITATSLLLICLLLASFSGSSFQKKTEERPAAATISATVSIDTIIPRQSISITTEQNGQSVQMKYENGKMKYLSVDGREIPEESYGDYEDLITSAMLAAPLPPAPPAPPSPPVSDLPEMPPMPEMPPAPPAFEAPELPELPDAPPAPPAPPSPVMRSAPQPPPVPGTSGEGNGYFGYSYKLPSYGYSVGDPSTGETVEYKFFSMPDGVDSLPAGKTVTKERTESVIVRERNTDGSYSYRIEGENPGGSLIEIDPADGVAIIDGQRITLDADSIVVIEEIERTTASRGLADAVIVRGDRVHWTSPKEFRFQTDSLPPVFFDGDVDYDFDFNFDSAQWRGTWDAQQWKEEWSEAWDTEKFKEEWSKAWDAGKWEEYWNEHGEEWQQYSRDVEETMREWKENNPEWEQQMREYKEKVEKIYKDRIDGNAARSGNRTEDAVAAGETAAHVYRIRRSEQGGQEYTEDKMIIIDLSLDSEEKAVEEEAVQTRAKKRGHTSAIPKDHGGAMRSNADSMHVVVGDRIVVRTPEVNASRHSSDGMKG